MEKLTELGVGRLIPVTCQHSAVVANPATVVRWRRRAIEAAKQSDQAWLPGIGEAVGLADLLGGQVGGAGSGLWLFGDVSSGSRGILEALSGVADGDSVGLIIGPEGGLSSTEVAMAVGAGCVGVRLGWSVLRVETAAVALAAVTSAWLGRPGGPEVGQSPG